MPLEYDELLESFVVEASEAVADLETDFLAIEEGGADIDTDLVAKVFRNIHSMKGTAGFCGLERIGALAHEMENILNLVRNKELVPTPGVVEVLLRGADQLTRMVADVLNSNESDTSQLEHELQVIEKLGPPEDRAEGADLAATAPADADADTAAAAVAETDEDEEEWEETDELWDIDDDDSEVDIPAVDGSVAFLLVPTAPMNEHRRAGRSIHMLEIDLLAQDEEQDRRPADIVRSLDEHGCIIQSYISLGPIPPLETADAEDLILLVLYATEVAPEMLPSVLMLPEDSCVLLADGAGAGAAMTGSGSEAGASANRDLEFDVAPAGSEDAAAASLEPAPAAAPPPAPAAATPASTPASPAASSAKAPPAETPQAQQYLRVSVGNLDTLMNLAGELVLSRNQLIQAASADNDEDTGETVDSIAARIDRITSELQEAIMQTRMQPVGSVFNKFPRIVRDLSKQLGKEIELDIHGKEVELDKSIIEAIGDPLTHLIRNACDHGVETPEKRTAAGKPGSGTVILKAFHQAGKVFITIEDDGNGIDPAKMRQKAAEKGMMSEDEASELSDIEAQNLVFNAGFSTAEKVTDVSGRGVGMDVVRTNIEYLGGMIEIDSQVGRGSRFQIQLPLTLAIIPSLVIFNDGNRYAIPQTNISELIRVKPEDIPDRIGTINDAEVLRLRGDLLPLIDLVDVVNDGRSLEEYTAARNVNRREESRQEAAAEAAAQRAAARVPGAAARAAADAAAIAAEMSAAPPATVVVEAPTQGDAHDTADTHDAPDPATPDDQQVSDEAAADGLEPSSMAGTTRAVNIIVVEAGTLRYGLVVDEVADSQEIVVKPLGRHMKSCQILAGATVLGDGQVALILDLTGVAVQGRLNKKAERVQSERREEGEVSGEVEKQSSLLFTNHDEEVFAVPTALISRIERIPAREIENLGGRDILQYGGKALPLMSLEHHVNAQPRPEQDHYHVVVFSFAGSDLGLIAPRLVDIRGISTEIDQNTFVENGVIGSVVEEEKSIRILDVVTLGRTAFPDRFTDASPMAGSGGQKVILLAEDSNFFRRQVVSFLESDGYEVVGCEDGQVAWQVLQDPNRRFDMILTDIEMPNMNGYELTRTVRADPMFAHLPIIALSSLSSDEDIKKARQAGVNAYQIKMDREALLAEIRGELKAAEERAGLGAAASAPQGVPA